MSDDPERGDAGRDRLWRLVRARTPAARPATASSPDTEPPAHALLEGVCRVAVAELVLMGAAIALPPQSGVHVVAAASDEEARRMEELQFDTAEGPTVDACRLRAPVLLPDLASGSLGRWPGFTQAAVAAGIGAAFSLPLHVGASLLGAMTLYRPVAGPLPAPGLPVALVLGEIAVEILVDGTLDTPRVLAAGGDVEPGPPARGRAGAGTDLDQEDDGLFGEAIDGQAHVYQAQGMVMVQLGVSLTEALARMRAYAYARDLTLAALSTAILDGTTRLAEGGQE